MIEILLHVAHLAVSAHALEAGIVATNMWLVKATYSAIPADERPHLRVVRFAKRAPRAVMLHVRHQHRLRMIPAEMVAERMAAAVQAEINRRHREKFLEG